MAYSVEISGSAIKTLKLLDKKEAGRILLTAIEKLSRNPEACPLLKGEFEGLRKLRIGDYRVIFAITGNVVKIAKIGHRKDVYD